MSLGLQIPSKKVLNLLKAPPVYLLAFGALGCFLVTRPPVAFRLAGSKEVSRQRRASQALGATYNRLVTRVEIDFKESMVDAVVTWDALF